MSRYFGIFFRKLDECEKLPLKCTAPISIIVVSISNILSKSKYGLGLKLIIWRIKNDDITYTFLTYTIYCVFDKN